MQRLSLLSIIVCSNSILFAQNVGVGTTNPQEKLHVAGDLRVNNNLIAYQNGVVYDSLVVGNLAGAANARVRVVGGKTQTDALTVGGGGFLNKMLSVYGDGQVSGNTFLSSLNVTGSGTVTGNARINGRIGLNGATHAAYRFNGEQCPQLFPGRCLCNGQQAYKRKSGHQWRNPCIIRLNGEQCAFLFARLSHGINRCCCEWQYPH
jgi:hypothetical protein